MLTGDEVAWTYPAIADVEYRGKMRTTRRGLYLERVDCLIPW